MSDICRASQDTSTTPNSARVVIEALGADSWTLTRRDERGVEMRIAVGTGQPVDEYQDTAVPFGMTVVYLLAADRAGTVTTTTSDPITVDGQNHCWLSDEGSGISMPIEIQKWPQRTYKARQETLEVVGRPDPVVLSDVPLMPAGRVTFLTRDRVGYELMISILTMSSRVLLRSHDYAFSVPTGYYSVGDIQQNRWDNQEDSWVMLTDVALQQILPMPLALRPTIATLAELNQAYPGTLQDIADAFPTLADLSFARWPAT